MNKYIILGDLHFGKSKGNPQFLKNQLDFFSLQLFPYMKENSINQIFQLGDMFDNRKTLDGYVYSQMKEFCSLLKEYNIKITFPLGNHDLYHRESLDVHLVDILRVLAPENIEIITNETLFSLNNKKIAFVPWLVEGAEVSKEVKNADVILGHFEMKHFEVVKGIEAKHGLDIEVFNGAKVYSGHYHNLQKKGNILYTGTPYQFDWSDFQELKGFWVTDFETDTFFENRVSLKHLKVIYDDSNKLEEPLIVQGFKETHEKISLDQFYKLNPLWEKHKIKFIINFSETGEHIKCIQYLKSIENANIDIINNFQVSQIIKTDYADSFKSHLDENAQSTEVSAIDCTNQIIQQACKDNNIEHVLNEIINTRLKGENFVN